MAASTISTIIPCFNHGDVLGRAVGSVYAQSGAFEADVIVIDDGSTDATPEVCRELVRRFEGLRVLRQPNGGLSNARNSGLRLAVGDYIHFLDADDHIRLSAYSQLLAALERRPEADVAYCGHEVVEPSGTVRSTTIPGPVLGDIRERLFVGSIAPVHACLVRRRAAEHVGFFDENLTSCEDWDYWLRLALLGHVFVHVPQTLVTYELGTANMSRNYLRMVKNAEAMLRKNALSFPDRHVESFCRRGLAHVRHLMFGLSYSQGMHALLENGRFGSAARELWSLLRRDPRSTWPAIHSLMRHKRAIVRGMAALVWRRSGT
jgi:glycosyltransferase involved in cell wall biosynthesis